MKFEFTLDEVQTLAGAIIKHYKKNKYNVIVERPIISDAPRRTTLIAEKDGVKKVIECQSSVNYEVLRHLAQWLAAKRLNCELYIATDDEAHITGGALTALRKEGVGLIVLENGSFQTPIEAKNFALIVNVDPALKLGKFQAQVSRIVNEFNGSPSDRKSALRDMCELVEKETEALLMKAVKKGYITGVDDASKIKSMDWSDQINFLARRESYPTQKRQLFDDNLKLDFQSFRGARNLIDHKVRSKREETNRQIQYVERMHQGPRLLSVLLFLNRKV